MAPLKTLEQDYPIIDSTFLHFCASHGIFTLEDFLIHDLYMLVALAEQHHNSERLREVNYAKNISLACNFFRFLPNVYCHDEQGITQILAIIDSNHQPWLNGMDMLEDAQHKKNILSTGIEIIDAFLRGGFYEGHVTEIVGPSSSGKTQVCLHAASNVAKYYMGKVIFLDTGNSFSPKRVTQFLSQIPDPTNGEVNRNLHRVMDNILCNSVFDIFALLDMLHQLRNNLESQAGFQVKLLIIDSISALITPVLGGGSVQGHAVMIYLGLLLKKLAHEHNLAVLMTNHMVAGEGGIPRPALGESWKSIPHVRLLLSRDRLRNIRSMSILRHPHMASGKTVKFMMR